MTAPASRVHYFERQYLRLAELRDEQAYHIEMRRRHNLSHHSWGIVMGLEVVLEDGGVAALRPGVAVDGYGRELLLPDRRVVGREVFDRYATTRLDLWLEYRLDLADDRTAPVECGAEGDARRRYRAIENAQLVFTRGGARPDPRRPPGLAGDALEEPQLSTPDDPRLRWPVYLGRIVMAIPESGSPTFEIDTTDRVYVGLNAAVLDHPGNAARLELGNRPPDEETRTIGPDEVSYERGPERDFAVFVPGESGQLHPTIAVEDAATQIRGTAIVHGNLILDGASLRFPDVSADDVPVTDGHPALYRVSGATGDELRIDLGSLAEGERRLAIGVTKDDKFVAALEIVYTGEDTNPVVTIHGDLHIEGVIRSEDMRTRTVTEDVAALLTGMVQAGIAAGS